MSAVDTDFAVRPPVDRLVVQTREAEHGDDLLAYADPREPLVWLRRGEGLVAVADLPPVAYIRVPGGVAERAARMAEAWQALTAGAVIDDPVQVPGTGLVGFTALAFDDRSAAESILIVPAVIVARRGGRSWITRIARAGEPFAAAPAAPTAYGPQWSATLGPGALGPEWYEAAVRGGLEAIASGEVSKVVVARDLAGTVPAGADLRRLARTLATGYPDCWTFAVDGLIGASPETLVTVSKGTVTARVLAGTASRGADADADAAASTALATSLKDQDEHAFAVQSVLQSLRPHMRSLAASEQPFTLRLPNVWHLATDVEGELADAASGFDLIAQLHPTAAVAGTPTKVALDVIQRLEPFDRGRYAGPVGWIDATGDGEWAIALRCAQFSNALVAGPSGAFDRLPVTAYAGAGIVAGSDPESELIETRVKFRPIVDALA